MTLECEFDTWMSSLSLDDTVMRGGNYHYSPHLPFNDVNREIIEPGIHEEYPEGALGIRVDDDFWVVAALPLKFRALPFETIGAKLWPEAELEYRPDSGSPEQVEYYKRQLLISTAWIIASNKPLVVDHNSIIVTDGGCVLHIEDSDETFFVSTAEIDLHNIAEYARFS